MPALPSWYARIPEILAVLEGAPPILDRPAFERLFQVSRRQAIRLMASSGGWQVGKTFVVDRDSLVRFLSGIQHSPGARHAQQRKQRILGLLRQRVVVASPGAVSEKSGSGQRLSWEGISLAGPGRLMIEYANAADLLAKIAALATAAASDYPLFRESVE